MAKVFRFVQLQKHYSIFLSLSQQSYNYTEFLSFLSFSMEQKQGFSHDNYRGTSTYFTSGASVAYCHFLEKPHFKQEAFEKCWGPFATASRRTPIHQVSLLSHAATVARRLRIDVHDNNDNA